MGFNNSSRALSAEILLKGHIDPWSIWEVGITQLRRFKLIETSQFRVII